MTQLRWGRAGRVCFNQGEDWEGLEGVACELSDKAFRQGPETRCGQGSWGSGSQGSLEEARREIQVTPAASRPAGAAFTLFFSCDGQPLSA